MKLVEQDPILSHARMGRPPRGKPRHSSAPKRGTSRNRPCTRDRQWQRSAIALTLLAFLAILVPTSVVVIVILLTMGNQIQNVFSNVAQALSS